MGLRGVKARVIHLADTPVRWLNPGAWIVGRGTRESEGPIITWRADH